jgi:hypothetical protein
VAIYCELLYLLDNVNVREAFFPSGTQRYAVEPARPSDEAAILAIAKRHDGLDAAHAIAAWWKHGPAAFNVVRERNGDVAGYHVLLEAARVGTETALDDPVLAQWGSSSRYQPGRARRTSSVQPSLAVAR